MKRNGLILALALFVPLSAAAQQRIQVRQTTLRQTASAFGRRVGTLEFNDRVRIVKTEGGFCRVYSYRLNTQGYVYTSAVVDQNKFDSQYVSLKNSGSYSADAITAATKGFSQTETDYSRRHRVARYDLVQQVMVRLKFDHDAAWWESFRQQGGLGEFRKKVDNKYYGRDVR